MNNPFFPEIKNRFGFGCMRLPMLGEEVDLEQFKKMVDRFMEKGFNYFDTAQVYIGGQSETALKACLTSRYPRDSFVLTDKLSSSRFETEEDLPAYFQSQLDACGVDYFDFYLMHAQGAYNYGKYQRCRCYEFAQRMKAEGKVRHVGISFHDTAEVLERILTEHPELEAVQIQFNYLDYTDPEIQSGKLYEVLKRHNIPVIVMEPVKGGSLAQVSPAVRELLASVGEGSPASYALRFAEGFEQMMMVLSGMSELGQMEENLETLSDFRPLSEAEHAALEQAAELIRREKRIACTACRYCVEGCPKKIRIPDLFACYNRKEVERAEGQQAAYDALIAEGSGRAGDCIRCGSCERSCPQKLPIRELLKKVRWDFD